MRDGPKLPLFDLRIFRDRMDDLYFAGPSFSGQGLQNGAITSSSGAMVRTTHLTGLTTDLGLGLARLTTYQSEDRKLGRETRVNWLRTGSIISFAICSGAGAEHFLQVGYHEFIFPAAIAAYASWHGYKTKIWSHHSNSLEAWESKKRKCCPDLKYFPTKFVRRALRRLILQWKAPVHCLILMWPRLD